MKKHGFTLIEIMVVMLIIIILISIIIPKISNLQERALRSSCSSNVKHLTQALILYTAFSDGYLTGCTKSDSAAKIYGKIFELNGWNNLSDLICPSNKDNIPPLPAGYGQTLTLDTTSSIDYWIVFTENVPNSSNHTGEINTVQYPGNHVLIIESFTGDSNWTSNDRHKDGGMIGKLDGSAEFAFIVPKNSGTQIVKADCAK